MRLFNEDLLKCIQDTNHNPDTINEKYYKYAMLLDANDSRYIYIGISVDLMSWE